MSINQMCLIYDYYKMLIFNFITNIITNVCVYIDKITNPFMPLYVYKVLVYDEVTKERYNVTENFFKGKPTLKDLKLDKYRIEYRFKWLDCKYRYVVDNETNDDFIQFSKLQKHNKFKTKIIYATLKDDIEDDDVLNKIKKYAGPNHDFFNMKIKPAWLFPSEDFLDNHQLLIMDTRGKTKIINMTEDDKITLC